MSLLSIVASSSAFRRPSSPPPKGSSIDSDWSIKNTKQPGFLRLISAWYAMVPPTFRIMISLFDHDLVPRLSQKNTDEVPAGERGRELLRRASARGAQLARNAAFVFLGTLQSSSNTTALNTNEINLVAPTGFEP